MKDQNKTDEIRRKIQKKNFLSTWLASRADSISITGSAASVIGLALSLVSIIITLLFYDVVVQHQEAISQLSFFIILFFVFGLISLAITIFFLSRIRTQRQGFLLDASESIKTEAKLKEYGEVLKAIEGITYETNLDIRRINLRIRYAAKNNFEKVKIEPVLDRVISNWRKYTQFFLDNSRFIFESLTGERCSVCIKIIGWPYHTGASPTAETLLRDNQSLRTRRYVDKVRSVYNAASNTAFNKIIEDFEFDNVFVCDNLSHDATYLNVNEDWKRHYNSVLVTRIGAEHFEIDKKGHDTSIGYDLIGFLCVDSKSASFDDEKCIAAVKALAQIYNEYLNYISKLFFGLADTDKLSILSHFSEEENSSELKKVMKLYKSLDEQAHTNRPIGMFIKRINDEDLAGVRVQKTPMIIHLLFKCWKYVPPA
ncbi:hypothetical protein [Hyphococcus sp.]|uniref:hypothetical protein n=1 Tax=Hyphococcus sp. TaxID=2038636 RepID=UPI0035C731EB